jgi:plasmid maintenance system killer protein
VDAVQDFEDFLELLDRHGVRYLPGNRLETLRGDLAGFHGVRINDQWRIVFRWTVSGPIEVDVRDYH